MFKQIENFKAAYNIIKEAFPISELRPYEKMKELYEHGLVKIYGYYDSQLKGILSFWVDDKYLMIENFAVDYSSRGKGIGSKMLDELCRMYKDKTIVLEVEQPYNEISERRIKFYKRNGFILSDYGYKQPIINKVKNEVPLLLMAYQKVLTNVDFEDIKNTIFYLIYYSH